jgi:hypothetical protein
MREVNPRVAERDPRERRRPREGFARLGVVRVDDRAYEVRTREPQGFEAADVARPGAPGPCTAAR